MKFLHAFIIVFIHISSQLLSQVPAVDWTKDEFKMYLELNENWDRSIPLVHGKNCMIAGTTNALAVHAGMEILKQGGSAVDAALVTAIDQIVFSGGSWNSFAGIMTLVYYDKKTERVYSLNAGYNLPLEEKDPLSIPPMGVPSGRTALIPGFIAGVKSAHDKFGLLPFEKLFDSAIHFAENGFQLDSALAHIIHSRKEVLTRLDETKNIFTNEQGQLISQKVLFKQPQLANTLKKIAHEGPDYIYKGDWAKKFVAAVQNEGGRVSLEDLKSYQTIWEEPTHGAYKDYHIFAPGSSGAGGVKIMRMLYLLEKSQPSQYGHYTRSAEALYQLIQISRKDSSHSDGIVVVDQMGNIATIVHTSNIVNWGTTGIFVEGISVPDSASF